LPGRARIRGADVAGLVLAWAALFPPSIRAQEAGWLYQVDVRVADQSPTARQQAARDGLAIVLSRVTGIASVPDDPRVRRALGNPDPYYVQFSYQRGTASGELLVRLQFSASALFQLIRETGLPIWPSNRPAVLAWALVDEGGVLRIPPAESGDPVERAMQERAAERGLVIKLATLARPVGEAPVPAAVAGDAATAAATTTAAASADATGSVAGLPTSAAPAPPDTAPALRDPEDVALRPSLPDGTPVWPTVGYWNAGMPELLALSRRDAGQLRVVARLHGSADGRWSGDVTIHDPTATPPAAAMPAPAAPALGPGVSAPVTGTAGAAAPQPGASIQPVPAAAGSAPPAAPPAAVVPPAPAGPVVLEASAPDSAALAAALVDRVVEYLLGRFQVEAGDADVVQVLVSGLGSAREYAEVLRIFSRVEVVSNVDVVGAAGDEVRFALTTNAAPEQLRALVSAGGRLVPLTPELELPGQVEPPAPVDPTDPGLSAPGESAVPRDPFAAGGIDRPALVLRWQGS
jgi:hypothetical protein